MQAIVDFWNRGHVRATIYQWGLVVCLILLIGWVVDTSATNLARLGITAGFGFLSDEAGFSISPALLPYTPQSSYGMAILVTLLNTVVLAVAAIFFATVLGFVVGVSRLSGNWLLRKLAAGYVEIFRNVPLLLQLFFWYFAALRLLPDKRKSINFFDVGFLNIEGFVVPSPVAEPGLGAVGIAFFVALVAAWWVRRQAKRRQARTGETFPVWSVALALVVLLPLGVAWALGFPMTWSIPIFGRFNFKRRYDADAGIRGHAGRVDPLQRGLYRRDHPGRHHVGPQGPARSGVFDRIPAGPDLFRNRHSPGDAVDRAAADQPVSQPDKIHGAGHGDRLCRPVLGARRRHRIPDRPGAGVAGDHAWASISSSA